MTSIEDVGGWLLGAAIGSGTTGTVRRAVHKETNEEAAIKIVSKTIFETQPALERSVRSEVGLMSLLDHPNLIRFFEVCESKRHLYIILEFAPNGELFDFITGGQRLRFSESMRLFRELIYGVEYLHIHGICHRDLKLENLLLDAGRHIKISDFGFARWLKHKVTETQCGSPEYVAPEVVQGLKYDGKAADIWSCGVILFTLLAKRLPFHDAAVRVVLRNVTSGEYTMPGILPEVLKDLIAKILVVDPKARITMADIKAHPGFLFGLPEGYSVPRPFPAPVISGPVMEAVDPQFLSTLRAIGYNDDDEIINELEANEPTRAKMFLQLFNNRYALCPDGDAEPWSRDEVELLEDQILMPSEPRIVKDLTVPLLVFMGRMQNFFAAAGFEWIHPAEVALLARKTGEGLLVRLTASFSAIDKYSVTISSLKSKRAAGAEDLDPLEAQVNTAGRP
jgi:BR serine/threonine kinase